MVMTPLFAVTQASQAVSQVDSAGGQVRATQGHQFTQTMEGELPWSSQSSVVSIHMYRQIHLVSLHRTICNYNSTTSVDYLNAYFSMSLAIVT